MKPRFHKPGFGAPAGRSRRSEGSVLVIVLWIALGLVATTVYFAQSMSFELRASENRAASVAADQAIAGAVRYVTALLSGTATNGVMPEPGSYFCEAIPVGNARFWLIGRSPDPVVQPDQVYFGLVDEGSKLNLNTATLAMLERLTNLDTRLAANIFDWRNTNSTPSAEGDGPTVYARFEPAYFIKSAPYETVEELRLVYGMDLGILFGEDANLNGALDPGETDTNRNNVADAGILDWVTVYSREPAAVPGGSEPINVRSLNASTARALLQTNVTTARLNEILLALGLGSTGGRPPSGGGGASGGTTQPPGAGGGGNPGSGSNTNNNNAAANATVTFRSPLEFFRRSTMTLEEFSPIGTNITVATGAEIEGRVNVNTATTAVLACLPGMTPDLAAEMVNYRRQNPQNLASIAWVADALQNAPDALNSLQAGDYLTTRSFQFSADIAALGPHGRGYRRVKVVFDISGGVPQIIYRQDLSHLGWALGRYTREELRLAANKP